MRSFIRSSVIIAAAGSGKRMKNKIDKPFMLIKKRPLLVHTVQAVSKCKDVKDIVLVVAKEHIDKAKGLVKKYSLKKVFKVVSGGASRTISVKNGLKAVSKDTDIVAVHDGARPFIRAKTFSLAIEQACKYGSACVCVKVKPTIKQIKGKRIVGTVVRDSLWEAQTPQVFQKKVFHKAYDKMKKKKKYTDDVSLVEDMSCYIRLVQGDYDNIKITTKEDLDIAEKMLK